MFVNGDIAFLYCASELTRVANINLAHVSKKIRLKNLGLISKPNNNKSDKINARFRLSGF